MSPKEYIKWYARSALGIGAGFAGLSLALALAATGANIWLALLAAPATAAAVGAGAFFSGWGPKAALAARDAARTRSEGEKLARAEAVRDKLARIRLGEGPAAKAAALVALAAGEYIEAGKREAKYDPLADAALEEALEIADIFLKEKDEAATEKRFGLEDKDPFVDAEARVAAALKAKAALIRERRIQIDGGLPASGKMAVREEVE